MKRYQETLPTPPPPFTTLTLNTPCCVKEMLANAWILMTLLVYVKFLIDEMNTTIGGAFLKF